MMEAWKGVYVKGARSPEVTKTHKITETNHTLPVLPLSLLNLAPYSTPPYFYIKAIEQMGLLRKYILSTLPSSSTEGFLVSYFTPSSQSRGSANPPLNRLHPASKRGQDVSEASKFDVRLVMLPSRIDSSASAVRLAKTFGC